MTGYYLQSFSQKAVKVISAIKDGQIVSDFDFDSLFPPYIRQQSRTHWTPIEVGVCAAKILVEKGASRVLDVGCGPGKFCLTGACLTSIPFVGVDRRSHLLTEGEFLANLCGLNNIEFIHSDMTDIDWSQYDGFYLFNPFLENICSDAVIDTTISLEPAQYHYFVDVVIEKLAELPLGAKVVTYHGFGGDFPEGYRLEYNRFVGSGSLECWVKVRHSANRGTKHDLSAILAKALETS